jgi:hypothetical protein
MTYNNPKINLKKLFFTTRIPKVRQPIVTEVMNVKDLIGVHDPGQKAIKMSEKIDKRRLVSDRSSSISNGALKSYNMSELKGFAKELGIKQSLNKPELVKLLLSKLYND